MLLTGLGLYIDGLDKVRKTAVSDDFARSRSRLAALAGLFMVASEFRTVFRYDDSRTWKSTRSYDDAFSPYINGRPIQINLWSPASASTSDIRPDLIPGNPATTDL